MEKSKQNQHEAFFIVHTLLGKRSLEVETRLLGPFSSFTEAREYLIALHERRIQQQQELDNVDSIFLGDNGEFSKIDTDLVTFTLQIFQKSIFL